MNSDFCWEVAFCDGRFLSEQLGSANSEKLWEDIGYS